MKPEELECDGIGYCAPYHHPVKFGSAYAPYCLHHIWIQGHGGGCALLSEEERIRRPLHGEPTIIKHIGGSICCPFWERGLTQQERLKKNET